MKSREDSTCCLHKNEAYGHVGGCRGCAALASQGKIDKTTQQRMSRPNQNDHRENVDGQGKDKCIQSQSPRDRASERKRAHVERGAGDVPMEADDGSTCGRI